MKHQKIWRCLLCFLTPRGVPETTTETFCNSWENSEKKNPWTIHGKSNGNTMEKSWETQWKFHGKSMENPWIIKSEKRKCFRGTPWGPHGFPWKPMGFHGSPWGFHGSPWVPMGSPWVPMGFHGFPWVPMGSPWVLEMGLVFMNSMIFWPHIAIEGVLTRQKCAEKWCATLWATGLQFSVSPNSQVFNFQDFR